MKPGGRQLTIAGFAVALRKNSLRLGFLVKDSLCMTSCNDIGFVAHFLRKELGVENQAGQHKRLDCDPVGNRTHDDDDELNINPPTPFQ